MLAEPACVLIINQFHYVEQLCKTVRCALVLCFDCPQRSHCEGGGPRHPRGGPSRYSHRRAERQEQVQAAGGGRQPESRYGHAWSERKSDDIQQHIRGTCTGGLTPDDPTGPMTP